jgi:phenylacetate-CoA ligase
MTETNLLSPRPDSHQVGRRIERAIHRSVYLGMQRLRGRPVGRAMQDLRRWDTLDAETYRKLCCARLTAMLEHARARVPLYRSEEWRNALHGRDPRELQHWPILPREALKARRAELIADGTGMLRVDRRSSASTGAPVTVTWNPEALAWSWAAEYHPMSWHGLSLGARTLRIWGSGRPLENWTLNRHFVPAHDLAPERLDAAVSYLATQCPELVWGSPSSITQLARHVGRSQGPARAPLVGFAKIGGEQVYPFQRDEIRRYLGARVIEAYGCTEVGPIAAECPHGSMHVLGANAHIEIVRDGSPVPAGELGEIVATTTINHAMPLIRCRIGDIGRLSPEPCSCGLPQPVLAELRGRAADLLLKADGTAVHGSVLGDALGRYVGKAPLGHAQKVLFQQVDRKTWKVQVESPQGADQAVLDAQITELVRDTFGAECLAECEVVPRIPRETSGKYRYYRLPAERRAVQPQGWSDAADGEDGDAGGRPTRSAGEIAPPASVMHSHLRRPDVFVADQVEEPPRQPRKGLYYSPGESD